MISEKVKELRKQNHLTQVELGKMCGVSGVSVYKWETGRAEPDVSSIRRLSEIFNVSSDFLLGEENAQEQSQQAVLDNSASENLPAPEEQDARHRLIELVKTMPDDMLEKAYSIVKMFSEMANEK